MLNKPDWTIPTLCRDRESRAETPMKYWARISKIYKTKIPTITDRDLYYFKDADPEGSGQHDAVGGVRDYIFMR